jgi:Flp pilus assembly protein TadD
VPDNPTGYTDLGVIYHLEGRETEAEQMLNRSIQLRPTPQAYSNLATVYFFENRYEDAVPIMEKLVATGNKNYMVCANLGDAYRWSRDKQYKAAEPHRTASGLAGQALGVNARDSEALMTLALCHAKLGQIAPALAALKKALLIAPEDSTVLFNAAIVYELAKAREAAIKYLGIAIRAGYSLHEITAEPELRALRQDPRYATLQPPSTDAQTNAYSAKEK